MSAISFSVSCLFSSDDDRKSAPAVPRRFSAKGRAWHAAADTPSGWQDRAFCHTLLLGTQAVSRQGKPLPRPAALRRREFCKRRFSDAARAKHADDASVRNGQGNILQTVWFPNDLQQLLISSMAAPPFRLFVRMFLHLAVQTGFVCLRAAGVKRTAGCTFAQNRRRLHPVCDLRGKQRFRVWVAWSA